MWSNEPISKKKMEYPFNLNRSISSETILKQGFKFKIPNLSFNKKDHSSAGNREVRKEVVLNKFLQFQ